MTEMFWLFATAGGAAILGVAIAYAHNNQLLRPRNVFITVLAACHLGRGYGDLCHL